MSLQQLEKTLKWWATLPYAKMLAIALAVVCGVQFFVGRENLLRYEAREKIKDQTIKYKDSVIDHKNDVIVATKDRCDSIQQAMLRDNNAELKQALKDAKTLERQTEEINRNLSKSIHNAKN